MLGRDVPTARSLFPCSKRRAWMWYSATRRRAHLWSHVHRPPHGLRVKQLVHGQGTFCQRLAGTLHAALCRTAADSAVRSGGNWRICARIFAGPRETRGMNRSAPEGPAVDAEEAFIRAMKRKRKNAQGLGNVIKFINNQKSMYVTTRRRFEGIGENHGFSACH